MENSMLTKPFRCGLVCLLIGYATTVDVSANTMLSSSTSSGRLAAIIELGQEGHLPLGIVFGNDVALCTPSPNLQQSKATTETRMSDILRGTNYKLEVDNGVYVIRPEVLPFEEQATLAYHLKSFNSGRAATMNHLASLLNGYISVATKGAKGFVMNSIGKPDDEMVNIGELRNVTAVDVANKVVTFGSKGLWVASQQKISPNETKTIINIYSYHDSPEIIIAFPCPSLLESSSPL